MLDDDDAVSAPDEGVEGFEQLADVVEVEASGGLVENEECRIGLLHAQVVGQLDALVFATREGGRRLPQLDVAQAYVLQRDELLDDFLLPVLAEELDGLIDSHFKYVVDVGVVEAYLQRVGLEALAVARLALQHQVGHELHFHGDGTFALAFLATAAFAVEAEVAGRVAHLLGQRLFGIELAYLVVGLEVGHGIAARRLADGILVDELHVAQVLQVAADADELARPVAAFVQLALQGTVEDVAHQRTLTRAADACYHRHHVQGEAYVDTLQVVFAGTFYLDIVVPRAVMRGHGDGFLAQQVAHRIAVAMLLQVLHVALIHHFASQASGFGADVDDVVGGADDFFVVLYDDHRVAQLLERLMRWLSPPDRELLRRFSVR